MTQPCVNKDIHTNCIKLYFSRRIGKTSPIYAKHPVKPQLSMFARRVYTVAGVVLVSCFDFQNIISIESSVVRCVFPTLVHTCTQLIVGQVHCLAG